MLVEWWDKREGPLPNPAINYPELEQPAAFACADRSCSLPVFEADKVAAAVDRLQPQYEPQDSAASVEAKAGVSLTSASENKHLNQ